jgi:hypothetical protein
MVVDMVDHEHMCDLSMILGMELELGLSDRYKEKFTMGLPRSNRINIL